MSSDTDDDTTPDSSPGEPARTRPTLAGALLWLLQRHSALRAQLASLASRDRPRPQRWAWRTAQLAAGALVGVALVAWVSTKDIGDPPAWIVWAVGSIIGAGSTASALAIGGLRHRLGLLTSAAFVSLMWGLALGAFAWAQPQCAIDTDAVAGRCNLAETATFVSIGMLFVVALVMLFYPPYLFVRTARWARDTRTRVARWTETKRRGTRAGPRHQGRVTLRAEHGDPSGGDSGDVPRRAAHRSGNPKVRAAAGGAGRGKGRKRR